MNGFRWRVAEARTHAIKSILKAGIAALIGVCALGFSQAGPRRPTPRPYTKQAVSDRSVNWSTIGGTPGNSHYSSLSQINRSNVSKLQVAWKFDTGESGGLETTPVIVNGVLYAFTPTQQVIALDGATGKLLWKFDSGIRGTGPDRGITYWTDGKEKRLLAGVMNFVYALDPSTGKAISSFGKNGRIDLRENLGRDPELQSVALTSPGVIYKDLLIVGGRNPETLPAPPGDIRAYDVRSGTLQWSFHTIPHPGEYGYETWPKDAWKKSGAANNWAGMAIDVERGIVFVPTGSAAPDFYGATRVGDDLFADTLVALDAATGKRLWHFQGVHHDIWDRDFPSPPILVSVLRNGKNEPAVAQTTKQGYLYLFDRVTGTPLFPIENRPYPSSSTPGEVASRTQPYPLLPKPFAPQTVTEDTLTRRTPQAHDWAMQRLLEMRHDGQFVPLSAGKDTIVSPSFEGGAEWGGPAVDPKTGILYINANNYASIGSLAAHSGDFPGQATYLSQCSVCHGDHREGSPPEFPSLLNISHRLTSEQIAATIHEGKGRMPAMPIQGTSLKQLLDYLSTGTDIRQSVSEEQAGTNIQTPRPASLKSSSSKTDSPKTDQQLQPGEGIYKTNCAICHGDKREGIDPSFPSLLGVGRRFSDEQILALIRSGKGRMPAFTKLSAQDTDSLMGFLSPRSAEFPNSSAPKSTTQYTMTGYRRFVDPDGYPATATPWGTLNALDLKTGEYLWQIPLGQYPELVAQGLPDTGSENYGGPIVTAGGLIFIAATNFDHKIRALDKTTGKLLWEATLPFAGNATPATYEVHGRQYVVIAAGGSSMNPRGKLGGIYVAFSLPQ
jgi:glucose dehydrogenase/mono/diheme cytochrome c family protein